MFKSALLRKSNLVRTVVVSVVFTVNSLWAISGATADANTFSQLAIGGSHACGLLQNGLVKCWGNNLDGQLGLGNPPGTTFVPTQLTGLSGVVQLALGELHSCALINDGRVECWGNNSYGQLGKPMDTDNRNVPVFVPGLLNVEHIYAGGSHTCALISSGEVKCWGRNYYGELGLGFNSYYMPQAVTPTTVPGLLNVKSMALGSNFTCALLKSGLVECWGDNRMGELGLGYQDSSWPFGLSTPTLVPGLSQVSLLSAGSQHVCAALMSGQVNCWGRDYDGELGLGYRVESVNSATQVPGLENVTSLGLGDATACAVTGMGIVKCWGGNWYGQLGVGATLDRSTTPVTVVGIEKAESVLLGSYHSCIILVTGDVSCWGADQAGQFGAFPIRDESLPRTISDLKVAYLPQGSPTIMTVDSGNRQALVNFNAPQGGNSNIATHYEYTIDGGSTWTEPSPSQTTSPLVISGLTNGISYQISIRAANSFGSGSPSNIVSVTPQTAASAPSINSVVVGNHQATVNFTAPTDNGGAEIFNYEYSTDGASTWTAASPAQTTSPLVITGLSNGSAYSVKLRAVNVAGSGAASNAVSVKPIAPASAPTIFGVTAGNGQGTLSISAPAHINDSSLSGYDYSLNNGSTWSHFASVTGPFTITGLTNATAYQVKVRAVNSAGAGDASSVVTVNPTKLTPAKPVIASVLGGNGSATVNITTPADVTAQSITGYQYSINKGATYQNAVVSNGSFSITGLTNGVSTSVQIRATNFNGNSLASLAKTVVPATSPAVPSITTITPSAGALSIAFTAPNTGGTAITSYQYSLDGGSTWIVPKTAVKTSPLKVTGLPNATAYQVKIRAVNVIGAGVASDAVSASTPVLVPSAPVTTSISKTSTTFTVDVTAPVNNGGGAITNYAYSVDNGKTWTDVSPTSNSTHIVITGLKPNTVYPVQIAAINSAGRGAASAKYNAMTLR